jgi:folate-binding protein YgfZ
VEVADRTAVWAMHRLVGPSSQSILENYFHLSLAGWKHLQGQEVRLGDGGTGWLRRFDALSLPAFDVFAPQSAVQWPKSLKLVEAPLPLHEILRVEAGLPAFGVDIDENRLVMEIDRVAQAICYTKGCFLGQEPIVMARDRGQVNRMLMGVVVNAGEPLAPGCRLFKDDKEVGQVTSSVRSPRLEKVIALAYLKRGFQEPGMEFVVEPAGDGRTALLAGSASDGFMSGRGPPGQSVTSASG